MTDIKLPNRLPTPNQLELARGQLVGLLRTQAFDAMAQADAVFKARNAVEFAAVVREMAEKAAEASADWEALSNAIGAWWAM